MSDIARAILIAPQEQIDRAQRGGVLQRVGDDTCRVSIGGQSQEGIVDFVPLWELKRDGA